MIKLKQIEADEVSEIASLANAFIAEKSIKAFNEETFINNWANIIDLNAGTIFVAYRKGKPVGMLGALTHYDINSGLKTATEMFWFVDKKHRGLVGKTLYREFIDWAKAQRCRTVIMCHFIDAESKGLDKFYTDQGFKPIEINYIKEV